MSNNLCQYELDRLKNIEDNQNQLVALGLVESVVPKKQTSVKRKREDNTEEDDTEQAQHVECMEPSVNLRKLGVEPPSYRDVDLDDCDRKIRQKRASSGKRGKEGERRSRKQVKHYTDLDYNESRIQKSRKSKANAEAVQARVARERLKMQEIGECNFIAAIFGYT